MLVYLLFAVCVVSAGAFLYMESKDKYVHAVILKGLASLCFVMIGMLVTRGSRSGELIVWGLFLGFAADVLLNLRMVFTNKEHAYFFAGTLVFLAGHILYLIAVLPLSSGRLLCAVISLILTAALLAWIFSKVTVHKAIKTAGVFYLGIIIFLNCIAADNMIKASSAFTYIFFAGAALFLLSDIGLILNTFGSRTSQTQKIINIALYYAGQLVIAASLFFLP